MPFPALPPRLELVVLLVGVATGYNLAMQILPREKIDLAELGSDEQFVASASDQPRDPQRLVIHAKTRFLYKGYP